jgi:hypothetical protein
MMKILLGVLLLLFVVVCISRDTHAYGAHKATSSSVCSEIKSCRLKSVEDNRYMMTTLAVKEIPPVGCAIPIPHFSESEE